VHERRTPSVLPRAKVYETKLGKREDASDFLVPVALYAAADHRAVKDVERRE
jgi:hypothetical protein